MTPAEFEAFLRSANESKALDFFRGMPEDERRRLGPTALRVHDAFEEMDYKSRPKDAYEAAQGAVVATATASELTKRRLVADDDLCFKALVDRKPPWLESWAHAELDRNLFAWRLVRRLVQGGHCRKPESPLWTIGFIGGGVNLRRYKNIPLRDVLLAEPDILETEVWKLFEVEGTQESSLAQHDKYSAKPYDWMSTLVGLAAEGKVSRARLLDASLDALQRDFAQFRAGWFSQLHEELKPTLDERAARVARYLGLLGSRIPPTVTMALDALAELDKAGRLHAGDVLTQIGPAILARAKKSALLAQALIRRAGEGDPQLRENAALLAAEGLGHEAVEVQSKAFDAIEKLGTSASAVLRETVAARQSDVAASLKSRLTAWLGQSAATPAEVKASPAPYPKARKDDAVRPTRSLEDAIEALSGAIERLETAEEIEVALDGVLRHCGAEPSLLADRGGPLLARASKLLKSESGAIFAGDNPRLDLCALAVVWLGREKPPQTNPSKNLRGFLSSRINEVADRVAQGQPGNLLALPTRVGGWIDPETLVERAQQGAPTHLDGIQSLLRLSVDGHAAALKKAKELPGDYGAALRYALGGPAASRKGSKSLWLAAARARTPREDVVEVDVPGPDGAQVARYSLSKSDKAWRGLEYDAAPAVPKQVSVDQPTVLLHQGDLTPTYDIGIKTIARAWVRWAATVWPQNLDPYLAAGLRAIAANRDWWEARWWNHHFLEPLLRTEVPLTPTALLLMATGLGAKDATEGGLATDALIQAVEDGRLKGAGLGEQMGRLSGVLTVTLKRWKVRLADAARVSPRHAAAARDALEAAFGAFDVSAMHDIGSLLELLRELVVECRRPVTDASTRKQLESIQGGGKAGRLVRSILEGA